MFFYRQRRTFWTAKGRFFYRCGCWRHAAHDGGDGGDDDEENSFSYGRYHQRHQGEAASRCYGFLCFVVTLYNIRGCRICHRPADLSAAVTPSANRNTYSVATLFFINTQGRGASPLNPGLWNRNSYRVAGRKPHPGLPQGEGTQCQWIRLWMDICSLLMIMPRQSPLFTFPRCIA